MSWTESLLCWFRPSHWRNREPLEVAKPADANTAAHEPDLAEVVARDASGLTDHDVSDPGIT